MKNIMEKLQQWSSKTSIRLVSAPYLPSGLIWAAVLIVFTDLMVILLGQPGVYWVNRSSAVSGFPFLKNLLSAGVLSYALVGVIYLILVWGFLTILTRSIALAIWMPVSFVHLTHIFSWVIEKSKFVDVIAWNQIIIVGTNTVAALIMGILLTRTLIKNAQSNNAENRFQRLARPALLFVWITILVLSVSVSAFGKQGGWVPLKPEHTPGRRALSAIAYDSVRQNEVLFGGISEWLGSGYLYENDTWEWDGKDWIEMHPKTIPAARVGAMMAFDEKKGVVIMFGGEDKSGKYMLSDTWEWDGKDWKQAFPEFSPPGRRGGQLFYDPETEKIILTGGFYYSSSEKAVTRLNDIFEWNGNNWKFVSNAVEDLVITNPNVVYDSLQGRSILFDYNRIKTWKDGQWHEIIIDKKPIPRLGSWLATDPESGKILMFGGIDNAIQMDDTWLLNGNIWTDIQPGLAPSPRDAHVMFYDPARKSFILYGGMNNPYALDDMWELVLP